MVYSCDHPSTALLEILVHMDKSRIPPDFQLMRLDCPDSLEIFNRAEAPKVALTPREIEVLELIAQGNTPHNIAANLGLSRHTVDQYLNTAYDKIGGARTITESQLMIALMNTSFISIDASQMIGTSLLQKRQDPLIRVRSAVMPAAWNYLINPLHPDAAGITVAETFQYPFDSRLLR